jgi:hypothetical protein
MSEFTELKDYPAGKKKPTGDIEATAIVVDANEEADVPPDDRFSWNPYDWYLGIRKEIAEFNFEMTERKRVVSNHY